MVLTTAGTLRTISFTSIYAKLKLLANLLPLPAVLWLWNRLVSETTRFLWQLSSFKRYEERKARDLAVS